MVELGSFLSEAGVVPAARLQAGAAARIGRPMDERSEVSRRVNCRRRHLLFGILSGRDARLRV